MDILNFIASVKAPTGIWANIINWLDGGIASYALVVIILTLLIKFIMLPFDFYNRFVTKKNTVMMAKIQPELNKINKTYANNPNMKNQKTAELYKRNNYNVYGTCVGMLVYMVLSMVIFFTLFSTFNNMSAYKISQEFDTLNTTYNTTYEQYYNSYNDDKLADTSIVEVSAEEYATNKAKAGVVNKYGEIKSGFLWIKNIWRPDTSAKVTLSYNDFIKTTKESKEEITQEAYEKVMAPIQESYNGWNGYFLLAIINGGLSLASMYLTELISKSRAKKKKLPYVSTSNKTMMFVMPVIMALFTIFYNSAFGIYIVAGSLFSTITSPLVTLVVDSIMEKKENKKQPTKPSYSR
jgi:YidC/Oxa1 family membrane protein insertase